MRKLGWALVAVVVATGVDVAAAALIGPWRLVVLALITLVAVTWLVVGYLLAD